jgi:hypothetical protein
VPFIYIVISVQFFCYLFLTAIIYPCSAVVCAIRDDSVTKAAVAVLGDLADTLGQSSKDLFKTHLFHVEFLRECQAQELDDEVRETAQWAQGMINQTVVS